MFVIILSQGADGKEFDGNRSIGVKTFRIESLDVGLEVTSSLYDVSTVYRI